MSIAISILHKIKYKCQYSKSHDLFANVSGILTVTFFSIYDTLKKVYIGTCKLMSIFNYKSTLNSLILAPNVTHTILYN